MSIYQITSESVTEGHPDKICDQISDAILDAYLTQDPFSHVAVECMISQRLLVIAGEVKSNAIVDVEKIARETLVKIGYISDEIGIDAHNCYVIQNIHQQSPDITQGVLKESTEIGAGDQGIIFGYACKETDQLMPLPITLAHQLTKKLTELRKDGILSYLLPDGKSQVTVEYTEDGHPLRVTDIIVSTQHRANISTQQLQSDLLVNLIKPVIPSSLLNEQTKILINPTGRFVTGGPKGDVGLTGRKIIVDTYGGLIPHGGGAFSGKDGTKLDRSGAYMARYAAKNIVAADLADRCQISVSYAIGIAKPVSYYINTYGTEKIPLEYLYAAVTTIFDFTPKGIIEKLELRKPIFSDTSTYGHFKNNQYPWEKINQVELLKELRKVVI